MRELVKDRISQKPTWESRSWSADTSKFLRKRKNVCSKDFFQKESKSYKDMDKPTWSLRK